LRKALDKHGLDYDNLTPQAKQSIPAVSSPEFIPGGNIPKKASGEALIKQIKSGGRDSSLAGLQVVDDAVIGFAAGKEAVRQGFTGGLVQSVKTASKATKAKMAKMTNIMRRIKKSERVALDVRPSSIVGDAVTDRIKFIRDKSKSAAKELDHIADMNLPGKQIDIVPVFKKLRSELKKYDVRMTDSPYGVPEPIFEGSLISVDTASQKVIKDLFRLLKEGGHPDALRAHKLKRQIDIMVDFNKKSYEGLSDAGGNVLKGVRRELNQVIRNVDPDYARVNDVLSQSIDTLEGLDKAVGSIDIYGLGANKALGESFNEQPTRPY